MRASTIVMLAAIIVLLGKWSQGKSVDYKIIVGGIFSALIISIIDGSQPGLAKGFAYLFLVGAALTYTDSILKGVSK
jgi:hypothetical protein